MCVVSVRMKSEFKRYGHEKLRIPIGILEILGGLGLLAGYRFPILTLLAALGLALLMLLALIIRFKIKDSLLQSLPALVLMFINFYIASQFLLNIG